MTADNNDDVMNIIDVILLLHKRVIIVCSLLLLACSLNIILSLSFDKPCFTCTNYKE